MRVGARNHLVSIGFRVLSPSNLAASQSATSATHGWADRRSAVALLAVLPLLVLAAALGVKPRVHRGSNQTAEGHGVQLDSQQSHSAGSSAAMDILYKYVTPRRALTCIPEVGDGTLRATQPAALNDPFECAVTTTYIIPDEAEENRELAKVLTEINESKPVTEEDVHCARREHGSLFTRQLFTEQVSTRFGIVSFTTHPRHPLMWSHYTTDGSGFVIGYNVAALSKLTGPPGCLQKVEYHDRPPLITGPIVLVSPESNLPILLSLKSDYWSYESEWRLIVELNRTIGTGETDQHGLPINLVQVPNEAVKSVYYTERTPPKSVKLIRDRLADKNNRYQAEKPRKLILAPTSYGYEEAPEDCQS